MSGNFSAVEILGGNQFPPTPLGAPLEKWKGGINPTAKAKKKKPIIRVYRVDRVDPKML